MAELIKGIVDPEHPSLVNAINNMIKRGYSKEKAVKLTGAPYEVVDRLFRHQEKGLGPKRIPEQNQSDE